MTILFLIIGIFIGSLLIYLCLKPQLKQVKRFDEETAMKNEILRNESIRLQEEHNYLASRKEEIVVMIADLQKQLEQSTTKNEDL